MSSHDALTTRGGRAWRQALSSLLAAFARRSQPSRPQTAGPRPRLGRPARGAAGRPAGRQLSRELTPIEQALTRESPELAGLFSVFSQLAGSEPAGGLEQLPAKSWPRPRPAAIAVLLALASVVALCLTLSARITPASRPCPPPSAASASAGVPGSVSAAHGVPCTAYPTNK